MTDAADDSTERVHRGPFRAAQVWTAWRVAARARTLLGRRHVVDARDGLIGALARAGTPAAWTALMTRLELTTALAHVPSGPWHVELVAPDATTGGAMRSGAVLRVRRGGPPAG